MTAATHTAGDDPAVKHHATVRVMRTRINDLLAENERLREVLRNTLRALEEHLSAETNAAGLKHCSGLCPCWDNEVQQARAALAGGKP